MSKQLIAVAISAFAVSAIVGDLFEKTCDCETQETINRERDLDLNLDRDFRNQSGFPRKLTVSEKECLALNLYHEARGEPVRGQEAVVYVVLNRAMSESRKYAKSNHLCDIVKAPAAFSWYTGGQMKPATNQSAYATAMEVVEHVINTYSYKNSPVGDATHYVNKKKATAKYKWWKSDKMEKLRSVGSHTFFKYKEEKVAIKYL